MLSRCRIYRVRRQPDTDVINLTGFLQNEPRNAEFRNGILREKSEPGKPTAIIA